jgi:hypothetical protein
MPLECGKPNRRDIQLLAADKKEVRTRREQQLYCIQIAASSSVVKR